MPDQSGKVAIVTGSNSGIGFQMALALAGKGARVTLACRSAQRAEDAKALIHETHQDAEIEIGILDLADLSSVSAFAGTFKDNHDRLDLLINNAGVMVPPKSKTRDGFELQFGINHLGHFALTGHLLP
ncbi:MAG: SDR family NAD(P)-dependent oxidoreductase, partial [Candidatus Thermoplasmatota archaeon]|nr:SDR family NAD(P)-dependent oxidoreductase [Candidatus Thermoplasmatota archaeon]